MELCKVDLYLYQFFFNFFKCGDFDIIYQTRIYSNYR